MDSLGESKVILIDDFLDKESIEQLNDWDLWLSLNGKYSWYDKSQPTNLWESFIEYTANRLDIFEKYVGFEYWGTAVEVKNLQQGNSIIWHIDKDETTEDLCADCSVIFYGYPNECWGGILEFEIEPSLSEVERFAPRYNRIIYNNQTDRKHRVTPTWIGKRTSFVFSGWFEKPPIFKDSNVVYTEDIDGTYYGSA